jgi:serine/threonine protein kinase
MRRFTSEIEILQSLKHENIVQVHEAINTGENFFLVLELCQGGDLLSYLVSRGQLQFSEIQRLFFQIVRALYFMHESGVAHRDIKPENILLDHNYVVKLADFGFSRHTEGNLLMETPCGSPFYAAPEIILGQPYDGPKADIWSVGVVLFGISTGALPWTAQNQAMLTYQISNGVYTIPDFLNPAVKECIAGCMSVDPLGRMTAWELLQSPFLRELSAGMLAPLINKSKLGSKAMSLNSTIFAQRRKALIKKPEAARSSVYTKPG